jgi:hypothetical protein
MTPNDQAFADVVADTFLAPMMGMLSPESESPARLAPPTFKNVLLSRFFMFFLPLFLTLFEPNDEYNRLAGADGSFRSGVHPLCG